LARVIAGAAVLLFLIICVLVAYTRPISGT
jgi:hypothetical protein